MLKIISGGQVGADRAGLDFAMRYSLEMGGWCPRGRLAEDGTVPDVYPLQETPNPNYPERTAWNVRDSDGTVIFTKPTMGRGSALTAKKCQDMCKPCLVITSDQKLFEAVAQFLRFMSANKIKTLNVAGSREDAYYKLAMSVLSRAWLEMAKVGLKDPVLAALQENPAKR